MARYFGPVAAHCPAASDQLARDSLKRILNARPTFVMPSVPHARDLQSAIIAANIARSIVTDITNIRIRNNVSSSSKTKEKSAKDKIGKDKYRTTKSRWSERKDLRVRMKYKYFAKNPDGSDNKQSWVVMERIERMVWYDRNWKSYLIFQYGEKTGNKGEPMGPPRLGG